MDRLIKRILNENKQDKLYDLVLKSLTLDGSIKFEFDVEIFDSAGEFYDQYPNEMDDYVNENWEKYFTIHNDNDDDDPPIFTKTNDPYGAEYDYDEMNHEMWYNYMDELVKKGVLKQEGKNEYELKYIGVNDSLIVTLLGKKFKLKIIKKPDGTLGLNSTNFDGQQLFLTLIELIQPYGYTYLSEIEEFKKRFYNDIFSKLNKYKIEFNEPFIKIKPNKLNFTLWEK